MTYAPESFNLLHPTVKEKNFATRENTLFDLDLGAKVTGIVAQFLLHHVTYAPTPCSSCVKRLR